MRDADFFQGVYEEPVGYLDYDRCRICGTDVKRDGDGVLGLPTHSEHLVQHETRGEIERAGPGVGWRLCFGAKLATVRDGLSPQERTEMHSFLRKLGAELESERANEQRDFTRETGMPLGDMADFVGPNTRDRWKLFDEWRAKRPRPRSKVLDEEARRLEKHMSGPATEDHDG